MIKVCGGNYYFQLGENPNNKDSHGYPIIDPSVDLQINTSKISSYSIDRYHSILIKRDGKLLGTGYNKEGQISGSLPKKTIDHFTEFSIKDSKGRTCFPISAVCGSSYTLYMVSDPENKNRSQLAYSSSELNSEYPVILNIGDRNPVALFGSFSNAAVIDSDGAIILVPYLIRKSPNTLLEPIFMPNGEKAVSIACCQVFVIVLTSSGKVFRSPLPQLRFSEVTDLSIYEIVHIAGIYEHCFVVTKEGKVFGYGSNKYGSLGLGDKIEKVNKFTEISDLKPYKIVAAYAGCDHSLFQTAEGKILACGDNSFGELFLSNNQNKAKIYSPVETTITSDASFCIAGSRISAVFIGCVPPNGPNKRLPSEKVGKAPTEIKEDIPSLKAEISRLQRENIELLTENASLKETVTYLHESLKTDKLEILDSEAIHNLKIVREISFGGSGKVVEVVKEEKYALKMMNPENNDVEKQRSFIGEYEKLSLLSHPNIIHTHGIFFSDDSQPFSILLEYCLTDIGRAIKNASLSNLEIAKSVIQIAEAMRYVHSMNIIHRDLKPQNVLIGQDNLVRVSDFGISKLMTTEEQGTTFGAGTQKFMAPEILNEEKYDEKVDVYSFGVLLFFMVSAGEMPKITLIQVGTGKKATIPTTFAPFAQKLIDKCWNFDPKERPSFNEICEEIENNDFKVVELTYNEVLEIRKFWKRHKAKIPFYAE